MPLLEVRDVSKRFGGLLALETVTFSVEEGETVGVIGPNGAGKTTLFNVITGFYRPTAGAVWFDDRLISSLPPHGICRLGLVRTFQHVRPLTNITVLENVLVGAYCKAGSRKAAERIAREELERVGLAQRAHQVARDLTIAELKRVELARALATRPRLLLLDEIMAGLNPREVEDAKQVVVGIASLGITVVMIEHVMRAVMSLSRRVLVIHHGHLIAEGTPAEVARNTQVIQAYLGEDYAGA